MPRYVPICSAVLIVASVGCVGCSRTGSNESPAPNPAATQSDTSSREATDAVPSTTPDDATSASAGAPQTQVSGDSPYLDPPKRQSIRPQGRFHSKPIIERDGRLLLWANGQPGAQDAEWFDMTNSVIDPEKFQYGIGKDSIPSIDEPVFVAYGDPALASHGITDQTQIIGFEHNGIARAYPVHLLNRHEVVNDEFNGEPFAVCW